MLKRKVPIKIVKVKLSKDVKHFSVWQLVVFAVIFAGIGGYIIYRSFAETTTDTDTLDQAQTTTIIDTSSQDTVNKAYWDQWAPGLITNNVWTGSVNNCDPGTMSDTYRNAQVNAINFARGLQQLAPISATNATANVNDLKAALIMQANDNLSHYPPTTWKCYTKAGANAAGVSDLGLDAPPASMNVVGFYDDQGNPELGHRRTLSLYNSKVFGLGTTGTNTTGGATAIQVYGLSVNNSNPSPAVRWPAGGYFPAPLAPGNIYAYPDHPEWREPAVWSYSARNINNISFSPATVSVTHNGSAVAITNKSALDSSYGPTTIAWTMPLKYEVSGDYTVTINHIKHTRYSNGEKIVTYGSTSYIVHFFDPAQATLKLVKQVNNNHGGTKTPHDWTLTASGKGLYNNGFSDTGDSTTFHHVDSDIAYTLSESSVAGYAAGNWSCDSGNQKGNIITLSFGQNVTCTITNNDIAPTLTVVKNVTNTHGGTKHANDFSVKVNGIALTGGVLSNNNLTDTYTYSNPTANASYKISEDQIAGYIQANLYCTDTHQPLTNPVNLSLAQNVTCTITNYDQ